MVRHLPAGKYLFTARSPGIFEKKNRKMKTILITGGTSGIGLACAAYLLDQNYKVIVTGRSETKLNQALEHLGGRALGQVADIANPKHTSALVDWLNANELTLDGVFLNAGVFQPAAFEASDEALFDTTMNINFKGAFFTAQQLVPLMRNPSSLVFNTSIAVFKAFATAAVYSASKAALESIAKVLNLELANKGIRVNVLSPGVTRTPIQEKAGMTEEQINAMMEGIAQQSPLGRVVLPEDIAPVLEFLLSDRSLALRNQSLVVDGGSTL